MDDISLEKRKNDMKQGRLPVHVAVIMDGNGRWAKKRNLSRIGGHRAGIDTVRNIVRLSGELGIGYLTLYTFSSENWNRPPGEVRGIMMLLSETIRKEVSELNRNHVRLRTIGDIDGLPGKSRDALLDAIDLTAKNDGLTLILALNYGGRNEIVRAVKTIAGKVERGEMASAEIEAGTVEDALDTAGVPDPDLLIRTSGEFRLSNFLLWQLAYTELWITDVMWPDFSESDFLDALESYTGRERRYGMTSQQVTGVASIIKDIVFRGGKS